MNKKLLEYIEEKDVVKLEPWVKWKNLYQSNNPQVKYSHVNDIVSVLGDPNPFVMIATYNGDGGVHHHGDRFRLGCSDNCASVFDFPDNNYHIFSTNMNVVHDKVTCLPYSVCTVPREYEAEN